MADRKISRAPRVTTDIAAVLTDSDGVAFPVVIIDVSSAGFRLRTKENLVAGEPVRLSVTSGEHHPCEIQWASATEAGGRFLDPVRFIDGIPA